MGYHKINSLNKKLELQKFEKRSDGVGGIVGTWVKIKNIWGSIELISNKINNNYNMLEIKATHIIVVRSLNNINNNMRFIYNDNIFYIKYLNNLNNRFTELVCECTQYSE